MVEDSIDEFEERVRKLIGSVNVISNLSFRKVLYLVMIDGMSYFRFPDYKSPSSRFVAFVNKCGNWPESDRVSLPQADVLLSETTGADKELVDAVSGRLASWQEDSDHELTGDPFPEELPDQNGILKDCQHSYLLWAFRNTILHEFRHPGPESDFDEADRNAPYYVADLVEKERSGKLQWDLIMPAGFLKLLAFNCLGGLVGWLRSEGKDPLSIGYLGRSWVAKLRRYNSSDAKT